MNEFEWLKQTRALATPASPHDDLWPGIAVRLTAATPVTSKPRTLPWLMAASLAAVSVLAGTLAWQQPPLPTPRVAIVSPNATAPWKPRDPRLTGAAIELNVARAELARAIARAPHDAYLQTLLLHTDQQLYRLKQLERRAG